MTSSHGARGGPASTASNYYSNDFFKAYGGVTQSDGKFVLNESKCIVLLKDQGRLNKNKGPYVD